ncbi:progestin and adipoQ receptor family member 4 [Nasonia vitripennis]|uniref:Progestin and adipoQ receptor family member 4 n=1 Tax=Nasonia vitripennis TaxID=7425 RepID=A0A7M7GDD4_NASVI|nr:progestin and adipoQ receptor family member 4 [Nasonia vitripennis]XP_008215874.1 progestin and adipoQ receptor family member 4 [Nasonia vitripennis]XP_016838288.1 progestin and adipoQ receptor family member 4 [Nasonia vitripennis]XP_031787833.1 progestin and adipoQ receptor family member 4 [Nasonia vitripennis]
MVLRCWSEMPQHLQFNPHIRSGYRPLMTPGQCIRSIFRLHNETVNILTHGFAIVYILVTVPFMLPWGARGALTGFLSWCHLIGAVSPWIGSFLYHVFMNLDYGEAVYRCLLKLDMLGIWICQSIGAMPLIAASVHCLPSILWHLCIVTYCFLSVWGLFKAMHAKSPWERRLCFSPPFMMRMLVLVLRSFGVGGGNPDAFTHVVLQDLIAVIGGTIGAMRIPEKWMPGRVDMYLNSHNIMHVMVVMAVCSMHAATLQDLAWMIEPEVCQADIAAADALGIDSTLMQHDEL